MTDGSKYLPYSERSGSESVVYFTRDLSPEGLRKIYPEKSQSNYTRANPKARTLSRVNG